MSARDAMESRANPEYTRVVLAPQFWNLPEEHLAPGEVIVTREGRCITTVLGSCVSVCLHHVSTGRAAICHSLLPYETPEARGFGSLRFVGNALEHMLDYFLRFGVTAEQLQAKLFGGARVLSAESETCAFQVGPRNVAAAEAWLVEHRIPLVAQDVGGTFGRKLHFNSSNGDVLLRRIGRRNLPLLPSKRTVLSGRCQAMFAPDSTPENCPPPRVS